MSPTSRPEPRDPRAEATALLRAHLGEGYEARVLEPSPPAVDDGEWFADDPVARGEVGPGVSVVSPVATGDLSWSGAGRAHPQVAGYARARRLDPRGPLPPVPAGLAEARADGNRLAFYAMSPVRRAATGRIGLRATSGGFGTPFFGADEQVRVEGTWLVVQRDGAVRAEPLASLRAAAELLGVELDLGGAGDADVPPAGDLDRDLALDATTVGFLAEWFAFGTALLEALRADARPADEPGRVQLWPEHFDVGVEIGAEAAGRATFGASPGDAAHPEPYLYVAPWGPVDVDDGFWADEAFGGASVPYDALRGAVDPSAAGLDFLREGRRRLEG